MGHTAFQLDRRAFLKAGMTGAAALAFGPAFLKRALAAGPVTVANPGPYGALQPFDANGLSLPPGFTSREIARGGSVVPASGGAPYTWHLTTDGQATFPTLGAGGAPDGGWILVANSEIDGGGGGVSAVEFAPDGDVERAYRILEGTSRNCAGGPTPWGTWLSCEERPDGVVHECDPAGTPADAVAWPALGKFAHEAVCVDPVEKRLYLTEDNPTGGWYRFTPTAYPDLSAGLLEVATVDGAGQVTWTALPDPAGGGANPTRDQVAGAAHFNGGEGTWYFEGKVYFTTKGDHKVWLYDVAKQRIEALYDPAAVGPDAPLSGVDNITVSQSGDLYVCEDSQDHDICLITPDFTVSRFLTLDPAVHGPSGSNENVGVVFSPDGKRMYFGSQRSFTTGGGLPAGVVYEISGPFRATAPGPRQPPTPDPAPTQPPAPTTPSQPPPAADVIAPGVKIGVRRRIPLRTFRRTGLPLTLDIDEPAGVVVRLELKAKKRYVTLARAAPSVAVAGQVVLRLKARAAGRRRLRGRRRASARLTIIATDRAGNRRVVRRNVTLT